MYGFYVLLNKLSYILKTYYLTHFPLARSIILSIGPIWNNYDQPTDDFYCCTINSQGSWAHRFFIDLTKQMTFFVNFVKTEKVYFIVIIIKCVILIKESSNKFQFFHLRFQFFQFFFMIYCWIVFLVKGQGLIINLGKLQTANLGGWRVKMFTGAFWLTYQL